MSNETIDLLTKLVLLAIAILILYKTWQYGGAKAEPVEGSDSRKRSQSVLLEMAEVYGAMLLPVIFILAFMFIVNLMSSLDDDDAAPAPQTAQSLPLTINEASSDLEVMLAAAIRVRSSRKKVNY